MTSELEQKVRELDNENERICSASKRIAKKLDKKFETVHTILTAERKGFKNVSQYQNFWSQMRGFINKSEYMLYLHQRKRGTFRNLRDFQEREALSKNIKYLDILTLDNLPSYKDYSTPSAISEKEDEKQNAFIILENIVQKLPSRYKSVIRSVFYKGKSLREVGEELKISGERIRQIKKGD